MDAGRKPRIHLWILKTGSGGTDMVFRSHIEELAIPAVHGLPSLLLYDLGSKTGAISEKQAKYIAGFFSLDYRTCVDNYDSMRLAG
jgi:hypothetical protein